MPKVLIVDDSELVRGHLKKILSNADYNVIGEAEDGKTAVEKFKELKPDIVTLDINMPKMNGIDTLKEIKKLDHEARIVMCTAMNQTFFKNEAFENGALDYVVKPFEAVRILEVLKRVIVT